MQPRIDVRPYLAMADYVLQLSNDMETYCYTINEALGYGVPIVTTPLSVIEELPIDDNMRIELDWDCSNVDKVASEIFKKEVKPFKYKIPKDNWDDLLVKDKSIYQEEKDKLIKVRVLRKYTDIPLGKDLKANDIVEMSQERVEYLIDRRHPLVEIIKV